MASVWYQQPPEGLSLEEVHQSMTAAAKRLNDERAKMDVVLFANVYVGPILITPRTRDTAFLIQYGDKDFETPDLIDEVLKRLADSRRRNLWWYPRRDPYLV